MVGVILGDVTAGTAVSVIFGSAIYYHLIKMDSEVSEILL